MKKDNGKRHVFLDGHKPNFHTLQRAMKNNDVGLVECLDKTGNIVAALCAFQTGRDGAIEIVPLAIMINGNPYEQLQPPDPAGSFFPPYKE